MYPFQGAGSCDSCYTQNLACSDSSQNIPLVNVWGSRNVDGYLEIKHHDHDRAANGWEVYRQSTYTGAWS